MTRSATDTLYLAIGLLGTSRPFTVVHRALYRRLGGRGLLRHGLGCDAVLLTTRGRHSGEPRTVPLFAFPIDGSVEGPGAASAGPGRWVVVASNAGRHHAPAWYLNVEADPAVEVRLGKRRWRAEARTATADEHDRLWGAVVAGFPGYDIYRQRAHRPIPIVVLEPR